MMSDQIARENLPIPDRPFGGTLPFDAKDPEATFPPIEPLRPPAGARNVLVILPEVQPLPHHGAVRAVAYGAATLAGPWRRPARRPLEVAGPPSSSDTGWSGLSRLLAGPRRRPQVHASAAGVIHLRVTTLKPNGCTFPASSSSLSQPDLNGGTS